MQGELETALSQIGWLGKAVLGAGRTDSGVHAVGQVVAFDLDWRHGTDSLRRALNANLPPDVAVRQVQPCAPDFHPRYAARARRYRYTIYNSSERSPLQARYAWHVAEPLQLEALHNASQQLLGRHDFATFGSDPDEGNNTFRTITVADWSAEAGDKVCFTVQAEAFLYRMARSLVGALKRVGAGEMSVAQFNALFQACDRAQCPPLAPACGLCLEAVVF